MKKLPINIQISEFIECVGCALTEYLRSTMQNNIRANALYSLKALQRNFNRRIESQVMAMEFKKGNENKRQEQRQKNFIIENQEQNITLLKDKTSFHKEIIDELKEEEKS